jgi:hypothetical protein
MRNEEPTRTDPPPGSTSDLAADLGAREQELAAALSRGSELADGFAEARLVLLGDLGHVELRRLYGRPC